MPHFAGKAKEHSTSSRLVCAEDNEEQHHYRWQSQRKVEHRQFGFHFVERFVY